MSRHVIRVLVSISLLFVMLTAGRPAMAQSCGFFDSPPACLSFQEQPSNTFGGFHNRNFFDLPGGNVSSVNQLWGDWFIVDPVGRPGGDSLVHIEPGDDNFQSGDYTFYGRYGNTGADNREPLGTSWGSRYATGGGFDGGANLNAWRDSVPQRQNLWGDGGTTGDTPGTSPGIGQPGGPSATGQQEFDQWQAGTSTDTPAAGTDAMDNAIDSAAIEIQDTPPTPTGPPRPGGITYVYQTITFPNGTQQRVPVKPQVDGKDIKTHHGTQDTVVRRGQPSESINIIETADGTLYGIGADGHNYGPMHESRNKDPFTGATIYSFDDNYPVQPPSAPSPGAADDQASIGIFPGGVATSGFGDGNLDSQFLPVVSDKRVKTDIVRIGALPSGLPVYSYRYIWSAKRHIGVMAQEVLLMYPDAVHERGGFLVVDYSRIR